MIFKLKLILFAVWLKLVRRLIRQRSLARKVLNFLDLQQIRQLSFKLLNVPYIGIMFAKTILNLKTQNKTSFKLPNL